MQDAYHLYKNLTMTLYEAQKTLRKRRDHGLIKCKFCGYAAVYEVNLSRHIEKYHESTLKGDYSSRVKPTEAATPRTPPVNTPTAKYKNRLLHGMGLRPELTSNVLGLPETPLFGSVDNVISPAVVKDRGFWSRSEGHVPTSQNQIETIDYLIFSNPKYDPNVAYVKTLRQDDQQGQDQHSKKPKWISPLEDDYNNRNNPSYNPTYHNYNTYSNIKTSHAFSKPLRTKSVNTPTPKKKSRPSGIEHHLFASTEQSLII